MTWNKLSIGLQICRRTLIGWEHISGRGEAEFILLAKDVTRHGSFWKGKNFYFFCLFYHKNLLSHKLFSFAVRVPFVSFILPYCALIIKSLMLKNSTWKNMFLRAWKHSLQCFLPLLPPQNPNQQVNFVFRLPPPPTQSLLWNINSFSGSIKKKPNKQNPKNPTEKDSLRHFTPFRKCHPRPFGWLKSRKFTGWEVGKAVALYKWMMNLKDSQEKPVRTCKSASVHWSLWEVWGLWQSWWSFRRSCLSLCAAWVPRFHAAEQCKLSQAPD